VGPNNELLITDSSQTTIRYAPVNPGVACTGAMLFPDIRQFDERVYLDDSSPESALPSPPLNLTAMVM
jgi:hypothetical protein